MNAKSPKLRIILLVTLGLSIGQIGCDQLSPHKRINTYDPSSSNFKPESVDTLYTVIKGDSVNLYWIDQSNYEEGYHLERALGKNKEFKTLDKLPPNTESYTDIVKTEPFWVRYRITPFVEAGDSLQGRSIQTTNVPFIPFNKVKPKLEMLSETKVLINWPLLYNRNLNYVIERLVDASQENIDKEIIPLDTLSDRTDSFIDSVALHSSTLRKYRIRPIAGGKIGPYSQVSSINTYMGMPRDFVLNRDGTKGERIVLNWGATTKHPNRIDGFYLEIRPEGETWNTLALLDPSLRSYEHSLPNIDLSYSFRLRTITSDYSSPITLSYDSTLVFRISREVNERDVYEIALNHTEDIIYYAYYFNNKHYLVAWDWKQNRELFSISRPSHVQDIAISPDDNRLLVASGSTGDLNGNLQVIGAKTGATGSILINNRTFLTAISPDGQNYVSFDNIPYFQIRKIDDNTLIKEYSLKEWGGGFRDVAFHPTAPYIAIKTHDQNIEVHDLNTKERVRVYNNYINVLEYDSEGEYLFDGESILDPINAKLIKNLNLIHRYDITDITLGPTDQFYAVWHHHSGHQWGDKDGISIYNQQGELRDDFETYDGVIEQVAASNSGTKIITTTNSKIDVWTFGRRWQIVTN